MSNEVIRFLKLASSVAAAAIRLVVLLSSEPEFARAANAGRQFLELFRNFEPTHFVLSVEKYEHKLKLSLIHI